jgi:chemotaxis protein MotA
MSIALVSTFYGSVLANVVFLPLAGKLKVLDEEEMFCKQLIIEGVLSIQVGENPRLIKEKLSGFLPKKALKKNILKKIKEPDKDKREVA